MLNVEEGEELTGGIEYATELFLPATAERMARHLEVGPINMPIVSYQLPCSQHATSACTATWHDKQQAAHCRRCCWQTSQPHQAARWRS